MIKNRLIILLLFFSALVSNASTEAPDDILTAAYLSASAGDTLTAAVMLENASYPENYSFLINAAYMLFEWNLYDNALKLYDQAVVISDSGTDAVLGLAWSNFYLGNNCEAWRGFREVLNDFPGNISAEQGIDMCFTDSPRTSLTTYGGWVNYSNDFYRNSACGLTTDAVVDIGAGNSLRFVYRKTNFSVKTPDELGYAEDDSTNSMEQVEKWLSWKCVLPCGSLSFTGGVIENDSRWNENSSILSLRLQIRNFGLNTSQSCYSDGTYNQYDIYWIYIPSESLDTKITISLHDAHNAALVSGRLGASYYLADWTFSAFAGGGRGYRTVFLETPSISNTPQETRALAGLGVNRELFGYGSAFVSAEYQYLQDSGGEIWNYEEGEYVDRGEVDGNMYSISFGINLEL